MRDHATVSPQFWVNGKGKLLRGRPECQVMALYLMTCPSSWITGIYYLPLPTVCHETGNTMEGAMEALQYLHTVDFAHYDFERDLVWVPDLAEIVVGPTISPADLRLKAIRKGLANFVGHPFYDAFLARYGEAYHLVDDKPLASPSEGLSARERERVTRDTMVEGASKGLALTPRPSKIILDMIQARTNMASLSTEDRMHLGNEVGMARDRAAEILDAVEQALQVYRPDAPGPYSRAMAHNLVEKIQNGEPIKVAPATGRQSLQRYKTPGQVIRERIEAEERAKKGPTVGEVEDGTSVLF